MLTDLYTENRYFLLLTITFLLLKENPLDWIIFLPGKYVKKLAVLKGAKLLFGKLHTKTHPVSYCWVMLDIVSSL